MILLKKKATFDRIKKFFLKKNATIKEINKKKKITIISNIEREISEKKFSKVTLNKRLNIWNLTWSNSIKYKNVFIPSYFSEKDTFRICGDFYNNVNIEEGFILDVNLFPNPNKGSFNIILNEKQTDFNIRVFNILGKEVYTELVDNYIENYVKTIDINLTKGTYIVNLETKTGFVKIPMVIE